MAMLLYDGDCAFCTQWIAFVRRRFAPGVEMIPWQSVDPAAYGVSEQRLRREVVLVEAMDGGDGRDGRDGAGGPRHAGGALALARTLSRGNRAGRAVGRVLATPPVRRPAAGTYRLVARNRYRLRYPLLPALGSAGGSGGGQCGGACALPPRTPPDGRSRPS